MNRNELLLLPNWTYKDVCDFFNIKKSKAYQIMKIAREEFNGNVRFNSQAVKRDSLLLAMGTTIEREIYILNQMKGGENEETL